MDVLFTLRLNYLSVFTRCILHLFAFITASLLWLSADMVWHKMFSASFWITHKNIPPTFTISRWREIHNKKYLKVILLLYLTSFLLSDLQFYEVLLRPLITAVCSLKTSSSNERLRILLIVSPTYLLL